MRSLKLKTYEPMEKNTSIVWLAQETKWSCQLGTLTYPYLIPTTGSLWSPPWSFVLRWISPWLSCWASSKNSFWIKKNSHRNLDYWTCGKHSAGVMEPVFQTYFLRTGCVGYSPAWRAGRETSWTRWTTLWARMPLPTTPSAPTATRTTALSHNSEHKIRWLNPLLIQRFFDKPLTLTEIGQDFFDLPK